MYHWVLGVKGAFVEGSGLWIQPIADQKYSEKKASQTVTVKHKLTLPLTNSCLHSTYIVLIIVRDLEMI